MKMVRILFLLVLAASLSGCILALGAAAGGTTALYVRGAAEKSYAHKIDKVGRAVVDALEDAQIVITSQRVGATTGKITGTAPDGKKVIVDLDATGEKVTRIKVRVGTLGDRERSEYLVARIDERL